MGLSWYAHGHQDPPGDIHPVVSAKEGKFVISFERKPAAEEDVSDNRTLSMTFAPDGRVVIPRHRVSGDRQTSPVSPEIGFKDPVNAIRTGSSAPLLDALGRGPDESTYARPGFLLLDPGGKRLRRAVLIEHPHDFSKRTERALPLEVLALNPRSCQTSATDEERAVVWADSETTHATEAVLKLSLVPQKGFEEGVSVELGKAAAYYSSPFASTLVWASGRWWIGWLRATDPVTDQDNGVRVTLSNFDPLTGKLEHKEISDQSYEVSTLSMAVVGDRLCLAWHGPERQPPHFSRICTVFEKLPAHSR